jgi:hypothetical protein
VAKLGRGAIGRTDGEQAGRGGGEWAFGPKPRREREICHPVLFIFFSFIPKLFELISKSF